MFTVAFTVRVRSRWRSLQLAMGYSLQLLHHMLHYHTKWTCSSPTTSLCGREVATLVWLIKQLRVALHFSHAHEAAILMSSQTTRGVLKSFLDWWTCWDKLKLTQHFTSNCSNPMSHSPFPISSCAVCSTQEKKCLWLTHSFLRYLGRLWVIVAEITSFLHQHH